MLILTRKIGETIIINEKEDKKIAIIVLEVTGDRIKLGINAPKSTKILREELYNKFKKQKTN